MGSLIFVDDELFFIQPHFVPPGTPLSLCFFLSVSFFGRELPDQVYIKLKSEVPTRLT